MNQGMIGKFLAEERKHAKYTQKQLADILNVSVDWLLGRE